MGDYLPRLLSLKMKYPVITRNPTMNSQELKMEKPWMGVFTVRSFMLTSPIRKTGRNRTLIRPKRYFFQNLSLMNPLHQFLTLLLKNFLLRIRVTRTNISETIRMK